jgi:hypothetical protein
MRRNRWTDGMDPARLYRASRWAKHVLSNISKARSPGWKLQRSGSTWPTVYSRCAARITADSGNASATAACAGPQLHARAAALRGRAGGQRRRAVLGVPAHRARARGADDESGARDALPQPRVDLRIIMHGKSAPTSNLDATLLCAIARGRHWFNQLSSNRERHLRDCPTRRVPTVTSDV